MELKPFCGGFVLATLLTANASIALADVLPPPPPPPPGANPTPTPPTNPNSGILEAPPPPPPGVNVVPAPQQPPDKPAPVKTQPTTPTTPTTTTSAPPKNIDGVPPPPPPPDGVSVPPPEPAAPTPPRKQVRPRQTPSSAEDPRTLPSYGAKKEEPANKPTGWYGWKSMIGLAPVYGLYLGGSVGDEELLYVPAFIGGVLVTPIMHWTHGNKRRGWLSFGFNIGTQMIGAAADGAEGAMLAMGIWNVIDLAFLHHADDPPPTKTAKFPSSFSVVPDFRPEFKGLSVVGQF